VTHHGREQVAAAVMVRASLVVGAMAAAKTTGAEVTSDVTHRPGPRAWPVRCARCGLLGQFVRHETLARAGRPEHQRRFRCRPP